MTHVSPLSSEIKLTPSDSQHKYIQNGWFAETEAMWPGNQSLHCIEGRYELVGVL